MMQKNLETNYAKITYSAPSNIAFVKYWGKRDRQIPMNPSLSMTLNNCLTETTVEFRRETAIRKIKTFEFEGQSNSNFLARFEKYLNSILDKLPWLKEYSLCVSSRNSFPHSTGIASSASAFAAFASCLEHFSAHLESREFSSQIASELARLGSGSAARSIEAPFVTWGKDAHIKNSSDEYGTCASKIHPKFKKLNDSILIVNSNKKTVGSSAGHALMNTHLFNELRYVQAKDNIKDLLNAMEQGDFLSFGTILETEALTLHALMMTSEPSYLLLEGNSLNIIKSVRSFREETNIPVYFTIDAGPNIHLIYPDEKKSEVLDYINSHLLVYCENNKVIHDCVGTGIKEMEFYYE